jgi:acyl-CoA synthetase (NDP forming)
MSTHPLRSLFHPNNIAVIGASPDASRFRGCIFEFLSEGDYRGRAFSVNPSYREIDGVECVDSIAAARAAANAMIDLAVIVIPAHAVVAELERCAAVGVRHALIVSSGFAEEGGTQADVQARISQLVAAESAGSRVIAELELNPMIVHADGCGLTVADALLRLTG